MLGMESPTEFRWDVLAHIGASSSSEEIHWSVLEVFVFPRNSRTLQCRGRMGHTLGILASMAAVVPASQLSKPFSFNSSHAPALALSARPFERPRRVPATDTRVHQDAPAASPEFEFEAKPFAKKEGAADHAATSRNTAARDVVTGVNYEDYDVDATYATELQLQQEIISQTRAGNYERVSELMAKQKKGKPSPVVRARRLQLSADSASLKAPVVQTRLAPQPPALSSSPAKKCDSTCHDKTDLLAENAALKAQVLQLSRLVDILSKSGSGEISKIWSLDSALSPRSDQCCSPGTSAAPSPNPRVKVKAPSPPTSTSVWDHGKVPPSSNPSPLSRVRRIFSPPSPPPGSPV